MSESILTHEYLKSILHYSVITGQFYWLKSISKKIKVGKTAGCFSDGYRRIRINGKDYQSHRLAWFWVTGEWTEYEIDHKNGIPDANYWLNLREVTHSQNMCNTSTRIDSTSGYKGVYWHKARQTWMAHIKLNGKNKHIGRYETAELAHQARLKVEKELHGDFARVT